MKYKTKIVETNGTYTGYALLNEEIVYTTNTHPDPVMVTRELSVFISSSQKDQPTVSRPPVRSLNPANAVNNAVPIRNRILPPASQGTPTTIQSPAPIIEPAPRRCCGR